MYVIVASKIKRTMVLELDDLKSHLKAMNGPDYAPLIENRMEIESLQERISSLNAQLIFEKDRKDMITKQIDGIDCTYNIWLYCYDNRNKRKD